MSDQQSNKDNDANVSKAEISKLVEDPYFQYLVEKKARSQTWTFLGVVGSAILLILLYGGWKFESVKAEIDKQKDEIARKKDEIDRKKTEIDKSASEVESKSTLSNDLVNKSSLLLADANMYQTDRRNEADRVMSLLQQQIANSITASQGQITTFSNTQDKFLKQQERILDDTLKTNETAKSESDKVRDAVTIAKRDLSDNLENFRFQTEQFEQVVEDKKKKIEKVIDKVYTIQDLTYKLSRSQATNLITLGDRQKTQFIIQEPAGPDTKQEDLRQYQIMFEVGDMGKRAFNIHYKIELVNNKGGEQSFTLKEEDDWRISGERPTSEAKSKDVLDLKPAKFKAIVIQMYNGRFAPEFIVIKIVPNPLT